VSLSSAPYGFESKLIKNGISGYSRSNIGLNYILFSYSENDRSDRDVSVVIQGSWC